MATSQSRGPPPPIRACLFDMDGLLIDSEDKYTQVINTILSENSRPNMPWSVKAQLQGRPGPVAAKIFHDWAKLPLSREEFQARQAELQRQIFGSCQLLPGAGELLTRLAASGPEDRCPRSQGGGKGVYIALATSSHKGNYKLKTDNLRKTFDLFPVESVVLGDDARIPQGRGKPCPDIYLLALRCVNDGIKRRNAERHARERKADLAETPLADAGLEEEVRPEECLVFEDSVPGVESGRRAGMQVIWVPHPGLLDEYRGHETEVLAGRSGMDHEELRGEGPPPGSADDGWAKLAGNLEGFDYAGYGMRV